MRTGKALAVDCFQIHFFSLTTTDFSLLITMNV